MFDAHYGMIFVLMHCAELLEASCRLVHMTHTARDQNRSNHNKAELYKVFAKKNAKPTQINPVVLSV